MKLKQTEGDLENPSSESDTAHNHTVGTEGRSAVEQERDHIKNIHWTGIEFNNGEYLDLSGLITKEDVVQVLDSNKEQFAWK